MFLSSFTHHEALYSEVSKDTCKLLQYIIFCDYKDCKITFIATTKTTQWAVTNTMIGVKLVISQLKLMLNDAYAISDNRI